MTVLLFKKLFKVSTSWFLLFHLCIHLKRWQSPCMYLLVYTMIDWSSTQFCWSCSKRVQQRLALYQGVCPIYMEFCDDSEATFSRALDLLQVMFGGYVQWFTFTACLFYVILTFQCMCNANHSLIMWHWTWLHVVINTCLVVLD